MDNAQIVFSASWFTLLRTLITAVLAYLGMILLLRLTRKRTLSRMTPFDLIIPLTLGPIIASTILLPEVALDQGLLAFATLIGLHSLMASVVKRSRRVRHLVMREPVLLFHHGAFLDGAMREEEVTAEEVRTAVRESGLTSLNDVEAVVLEVDGTFNVLHRSLSAGDSVLADVTGYPGAEGAEST
jgi:uncharacterized membrane protein YcaP (DUF421 family)